MSEKAMWGVIRDGMRGRWQCQRLEDKFAKGVPDVMYQLPRGGAGFLELKYSAKPATGNRVQQLPHFTIEQRRFLELWHPCKVLWRIGDSWLLFDQGFEELGHIGSEELINLAEWVWYGTPNWQVLADRLGIRSA